jgi:Flp pilus assembly protein, pilin Flp
MTFIRNFLADDSGAAAAEYVLILAIVGAGIGAGAFYLGGTIKTALSNRATTLSSCAASTTTAPAC